MTDQKKTARISPDRRIVGAALIALVGVIMAASYIFSYATIADAAIWAGTPENADWVRFLAPIFIDGAILTYTSTYAVFRWRGEPDNSRKSRVGLWVFTLISVVVNGAHAGAHWAFDFSRYEAWVGVLIGVSAPLAALFAAEELIRLTFEQVLVDLSAPVVATAHELADVTEPVRSDASDEAVVSLADEATAPEEHVLPVSVEQGLEPEPEAAPHVPLRAVLDPVGEVLATIPRAEAEPAEQPTAADHGDPAGEGHLPVDDAGLFEVPPIIVPETGPSVLPGNLHFVPVEHEPEPEFPGDGVEYREAS